MTFIVTSNTDSVRSFFLALNVFHMTRLWGTRALVMMCPSLAVHASFCAEESFHQRQKHALDCSLSSNKVFSLHPRKKYVYENQS